jgi:hypothetical protein
MKIVEDKVYLSASDLSTYIACPHATFLNLEEVKGLRKAPVQIYGSVRALQEKGEEFERNCLQQLRAQGKKIVEIDKSSRSQALENTKKAMANGADIIYQARLELDVWNGWADFLLGVEES